MKTTSDPDTAIGGSRSHFPETNLSAIRAAHGLDSTVRRYAWDKIAGAYWKPVYKYIRIRWKRSNEDAKDLTQAFFTRAMEKDFFARFDPQRACFRTYLRTCLDGFVSNERAAGECLKRGGEFTLVGLDFETAEGELRQHDVPGGASIEQCFHAEWVRGLFADAVETLRDECRQQNKQIHFALFERYDLDANSAEVSYQELAAAHALTVSTVTNYLAFARREFRRIVLERLREITGGEDDFRQEARLLFGSNRYP